MEYGPDLITLCDPPAGNMTSALGAFKEMRLMEYEPDLITFNTLVHGFAELGDVVKARAIIGAEWEPGALALAAPLTRDMGALALAAPLTFFLTHAVQTRLALKALSLMSAPTRPTCWLWRARGTLQLLAPP